MIEIAEEIAVPSPPERVWAVVSDPSDVVSCIPGAELGTAHDDGSFDGVLVAKFAAIRVTFAARVSLELDEPAREGHLSARGRDGQGATRFSGGATFGVTEDGDGSRVTVRGEVKLSGKLASLIESGAGVVISRMTKEFSGQLIERCTELSADSVPAPAVSVPPRIGALARFRSWWARLLHPRRTPSAVSSHHTSEEVGSGRPAAQ